MLDFVETMAYVILVLGILGSYSVVQVFGVVKI